MKKFSIRYQGQSGQEEYREFIASTSDEAEQMAKVQGILPLEINELSEGGPGIMAWFQGSVSLPELFHFTRLMGTLTRAGLPILEAIDTIREKMPNPRFRTTLDKIYTDIQGGTTLAAAFAAHPGVFDFTYQNLIKVGEESGEIGQVLGRLVGMLDRQIRLRRAIKRALTYPVLVMVISGLVTYAILTYIVPRFKDIYKRFGGDLPGLTKVTMAVSDFLVDHTPVIIIVLILTYICFKILEICIS